jgi:hypothetical protein
MYTCPSSSSCETASRYILVVTTVTPNSKLIALTTRILVSQPS